VQWVEEREKEYEGCIAQDGMEWGDDTTHRTTRSGSGR